MSRHTHEVSAQAWQEFLVAHSDGGVLQGNVMTVVPFGRRDSHPVTIGSC
jgi:hypothetical protein